MKLPHTQTHTHTYTNTISPHPYSPKMCITTAMWVFLSADPKNLITYIHDRFLNAAFTRVWISTCVQCVWVCLIYHPNNSQVSSIQFNASLGSLKLASQVNQPSKQVSNSLCISGAEDSRRSAVFANVQRPGSLHNVRKQNRNMMAFRPDPGQALIPLRFAMLSVTGV